MTCALDAVLIMIWHSDLYVAVMIRRPALCWWLPRRHCEAAALRQSGGHRGGTACRMPAALWRPFVTKGVVWRLCSVTDKSWGHTLCRSLLGIPIAHGPLLNVLNIHDMVLQGFALMSHEYCVHGQPIHGDR
jgi:hypothetical protein